jgi:WD40 repeat protein
MFENGMVDIWNISTRTRNQSQDWHFTPLMGLAISPDDHTLAYQLGNEFVDVVSIDQPTESTLIRGTLPRGNPISIDNKLTIVQLDPKDRLNVYSLPILTSQEPIPYYDYPPNGTVSFSPDGSVLAAISNSTFTYWSIPTAVELKPKVIRSLKSCQIIIGQDDNFIAAGSESGVTFSDANKNFFCQVARNPRHLSEAFLSDGSVVAQALENHLVDVWDQDQGDQKFQITTRSAGDARDVAISIDGTFLAVALESGDLEIYNLKTRQLLKDLELKAGPINQVLFSNNGKYIIIVSSDGTMRFFGYHR